MTAQEVFDYTMSLIDERLETGLIDTDTTLVYTKNAPYFITMIQDELAQKSDYTKKVTINVSTETEGYVEVTLPTDYKELYQLVDSDLEQQTDYKVIGNDLFVPYDFAGYLIYRPILAPITALTETLTLDNDICRDVIPYGLASRLLTNENGNLSNYFNSLYEEHKNLIKSKQPAPIGKIKDVYSSSLTW